MATLYKLVRLCWLWVYLYTFLHLLRLFVVFLLMIPLLGRSTWLSQLQCGLQILVIVIKLNTLFGENNLLLFFLLSPITLLIDSHLSLNISHRSVYVLILHLDIRSFCLCNFLVFFFEVFVELVSWVDDEWEDNDEWAFGVHRKKHVCGAVCQIWNIRLHSYLVLLSSPYCMSFLKELTSWFFIILGIFLRIPDCGGR